MTTLLDTLRMQRRLRDTGFSEDQADAITEEFTNIMTGAFATKADLLELKSELAGNHSELAGQIAGVKSEVADVKGEVANVKSEVANVKSEVADLKVGIADFKTDIVKWAVGIVAAVLVGCAGIAVAVVLSLGRLSV